MKGQMFILTVIFLVGLIYVVQQNLSGYAVLDLSEPFEDNSYYIFKYVKDAFSDTTATTRTCFEAEANLNELVNYISRKILFGGFTLDLRHNLDCARWDNTDPAQAPLNLTIRIIGKHSEVYAAIPIYHQVPPHIYYAYHVPCSVSVGGSSGSVQIYAKATDLNGKSDITTSEATITLLLHGNELPEHPKVALTDGNSDDVYEGTFYASEVCKNGDYCDQFFVTVEFCDAEGQCTPKDIGTNCQN
jgi:hypothetical protein